MKALGKQHSSREKALGKVLVPWLRSHMHGGKSTAPGVSARSGSQFCFLVTDILISTLITLGL